MRRRNQGFSLIEILVGLALLSAISLGLISVFTDAFKLQKRTDFQVALQQLANDIARNLEQDTAYLNSVNATLATPPVLIQPGGTSLVCLTNPNTAGCPGQFTMYFSDIRDGGNRRIVLAGPAQTQLPPPPAAPPAIPAAPGNRGFTFAGSGNSVQACNTFQGGAPGTAPNDNCPFTVSVRIDSNCPGAAPCPNPTLGYEVIFNFNPSSGESGLKRTGPLNMATYRRVGVPRSAGAPMSPQGLCTMLNGIYVGFPQNTCTLRDANTCALGQYLARANPGTGINQFICHDRFEGIPACGGANEGTAITGTNAAVCRSFARAPSPTTCGAPGQYAVGINASGDVVCANAPPVPTTPQLNQFCDPPDILRGYNADGSKNCGRSLECTVVSNSAPGAPSGGVEAFCDTSQGYKRTGGGGECVGGGGEILWVSRPWDPEGWHVKCKTGNPTNVFVVCCR